MPHFMVNMIPTGILGLIISALLSAAMSTISSGMNASATVFTEDIYKRYINKNGGEAKNLKVLYLATVIVGLVGMCCGIAMIGVKSLLDIWWTLSGIFAGGMLGLFLLGLIAKKASNNAAIIAVLMGVTLILWMSLSYLLPENLAYLKYPLHSNFNHRIRTLTICLVGLLVQNRTRK